MGQNIARLGKVTRVMNAVAAGQTLQSSSSVDMTGFGAVTFIASFGAITATAVTSVHLETSSDDSSFNDLTGTNITVADDDDNQVAIIELDRPLERYIRCVISRGTANAVIDGIVAIQSRANVEPVTHDASTVVDSEYHHAAAEGSI